MKALKWPAVKAERSEPKGSLDSNRAAKELKSRKVGTEVKQRKSAKKLDWEKRSQILQKNCCLILAMRPIYHFSPKRISAHILICYLAFAVTRYMYQDINDLENVISIEGIREALAGVETSILRDKEGRLYSLPAPLNKEATKIYGTLRLSRSRAPRALSSREAVSFVV